MLSNFKFSLETLYFPEFSLPWKIDKYTIFWFYLICIRGKIIYFTRITKRVLWNFVKRNWMTGISSNLTSQINQGRSNNDHFEKSPGSLSPLSSKRPMDFKAHSIYSTCKHLTLDLYFVSRDFSSHSRIFFYSKRCHHYRRRAAYFDLYPALMAIDNWVRRALSSICYIYCDTRVRDIIRL